MRKAYYLSSCTTCKRILSEIDTSSFELQDIKTVPMTAEQLEEMANLAGSYESLFSRRAMKYKELKLANQTLTEDDYKTHILAHYTFLKRPVFLVDDKIFIGNSKKTVAALKEALV